MKCLAIAFSFLASITIACAQDVNQDGFVSFLVPIISDQPINGLNGTVWNTELWIHTDTAMRLRGCGFNLPATQTCPPHLAGVTERAFPSEVVNFAAALVYNVPAALAPGISLSNRLFEQTQRGQPVGVEVPVIREDRFFTSPVRFVGIPNSSRTRVALRLYDPRRQPGLAVRVELLDTLGAPIADTVIYLEYKNVSEYGEPGFAAVYDLAASFPQLAVNPRFDIRLTPLNSGNAYWGLVSVTDNETEQVLLITADSNSIRAAPATQGETAVNTQRRRAVATAP